MEQVKKKISNKKNLSHCSLSLCAIKYKKIIVVEDHFQDGDFQSWLNDSVNNKNRKTYFLSQSISSFLVDKVGSKKYLMMLLK